jgi:hypothetical protein
VERRDRPKLVGHTSDETLRRVRIGQICSKRSRVNASRLERTSRFFKLVSAPGDEGDLKALAAELVRHRVRDPWPVSTNDDGLLHISVRICPSKDSEIQRKVSPSNPGATVGSSIRAGVNKQFRIVVGHNCGWRRCSRNIVPMVQADCRRHPAAERTVARYLRSVVDQTESGPTQPY